MYRNYGGSHEAHRDSDPFDLNYTKSMIHLLMQQLDPGIPTRPLGTVSTTYAARKRLRTAWPRIGQIIAGFSIPSAGRTAPLTRKNFSPGENFGEGCRSAG